MAINPDRATMVAKLVEQLATAVNNLDKVRGRIQRYTLGGQKWSIDTYEATSKELREAQADIDSLKSELNSYLMVHGRGHGTSETSGRD